MANIRENKRNGKTVSFRFTACLERDAQGKQVRRYITWTPPEGLTPAKAKKAAERAADIWEEEVKAEYQKEKEAKAQGAPTCSRQRSGTMILWPSFKTSGCRCKCGTATASRQPLLSTNT